MSEISNSDLLNVLLDIRGDIGQSQAQIAAVTRAFEAHVVADAAMAADIQKINLGAARQRGIFTALSAVGTVLGACIGYAIDAITLRGHH